MFEVRTRPGRNRLYFTMRGAISLAEAQQAVEQVITESARLRPGFDTITDINGLDPLSPEVLEQIDRINRHLAKMAPGKVVRVVGRSVHAAVQFEKLSKKIGHSAQLAFSLEEAERLLDGMPEEFLG